MRSDLYRTKGRKKQMPPVLKWINAHRNPKNTLPIDPTLRKNLSILIYWQFIDSIDDESDDGRYRSFLTEKAEEGRFLLSTELREMTEDRNGASFQSVIDQSLKEIDSKVLLESIVSMYPRCISEIIINEYDTQGYDILSQLNTKSMHFEWWADGEIVHHAPAKLTTHTRNYYLGSDFADAILHARNLEKQPILEEKHLTMGANDLYLYYLHCVEIKETRPLHFITTCLSLRRFYKKEWGLGRLKYPISEGEKEEPPMQKSGVSLGVSHKIPPNYSEECLGKTEANSVSFVVIDWKKLKESEIDALSDPSNFLTFLIKNLNITARANIATM